MQTKGKKSVLKDASKILSHEKWIAFSAIEQQQDNLNMLGEDIWRVHEPHGHEKLSHDTLVHFLQRRDFKVQSHYMGFENAFRASYGENATGGAEHPNIGFLCQYDADPDRGHNYGHNLVTAVAVTAALGLQPVIKFSQEPIGMVTVIGCPNNATGTRKIEMLEAGCFKGIDFLLAAYPANFTSITPRFIGSRTHKISFRGRTRMETERPWEVANPVNATVLAYQNITAMRQQFACEWTAKGVILNGGTKADVMPETASMEYLLKAPKPLEIKVLGDMVHQCFQGAATATGCTFEVESTGKEFLCNVVPNTLAGLYTKNATLMGFTYHNLQDQLRAPDDIANVSTSVPTLKIFYYAGTSTQLGTDDFSRYAGSKDSQFMTIVQGKALAMMAIDLITSEERMREVFEEHQEELTKFYGQVDYVPMTDITAAAAAAKEQEDSKKQGSRRGSRSDPEGLAEQGQDKTGDETHSPGSAKKKSADSGGQSEVDSVDLLAPANTRASTGGGTSRNSLGAPEGAHSDQ